MIPIYSVPVKRRLQRYICRICGQEFTSPFTHYMHIHYSCPNVQLKQSMPHCKIKRSHAFKSWKAIKSATDL